MKGIVFAAALAAAAPAWALNPAGSGSVAVELNDEVLHPSAQAVRFNGVTEQVDNRQKDSETWSVDAVLPVGDAWALALSGNSSLGAWSEKVTNNLGGYYSLDGNSQGTGLGLGAWLRTGSLFGRDWSPERDHPEGPAWWPVLEPSLSWSDMAVSWTVGPHLGYTVSQPPDGKGMDLGGGLLLLLPLSRGLAVFGSYHEGLLSDSSQGSASSSSSFDSGDWMAGASWILHWMREDPGQPYVPGLRRVGALRLRGEWAGSYDMKAGRQVGRWLSLSAAAPVSDHLAVLLGWEQMSTFRQAFDGDPGLISQTHGSDPQRVYGSVTLSFGDAAHP